MLGLKLNQISKSGPNETNLGNAGTYITWIKWELGSLLLAWFDFDPSMDNQ